MTSLTRYLSPPQYAKRLGIDPAKVLAWIKSGKLRAFDVRGDGSTRPRFRIPLDAIVEFESRRSARVPPKTVRRKRTKQPADYVEYF